MRENDYKMALSKCSDHDVTHVHTTESSAVRCRYRWEVIMGRITGHGSPGNVGFTVHAWGSLMP